MTDGYSDDEANVRFRRLLKSAVNTEPLSGKVLEERLRLERLARWTSGGGSARTKKVHLNGARPLVDANLLQPRGAGTVDPTFPIGPEQFLELTAKGRAALKRLAKEIA